MEDNWKGIKKALTSTCQKLLDRKKYHHKEMISIEILARIEVKENRKTAINNSRSRTEEPRAQTKYTKVNKTVRRTITANGQKYVEDLAVTAQKASGEGNMRQLYDTKKRLEEKYNEPERTVNREGETITAIHEQKNR
ncbi:unnamed protein product [Schistosoma margrebowiei]|uniref:Uncharacterized protein n=1 Tax=Schistosoma margrebowiei TaxID=48269 RepID=A0A183MF86_9TREM|nr:unnamed protein product [Schistosoma margrebowiei]